MWWKCGFSLTTGRQLLKLFCFTLNLWIWKSVFLWPSCRFPTTLGHMFWINGACWRQDRRNLRRLSWLSAFSTTDELIHHITHAFFSYTCFKHGLEFSYRNHVDRRDWHFVTLRWNSDDRPSCWSTGISGEYAHKLYFCIVHRAMPFYIGFTSASLPLHRPGQNLARSQTILSRDAHWFGHRQRLAGPGGSSWSEWAWQTIGLLRFAPRMELVTVKWWWL